LPILKNRALLKRHVKGHEFTRTGKCPNSSLPQAGLCGTIEEVAEKSLAGASDSSTLSSLAPHTTEGVFEDYGFRRGGSVFRSSSQKTDPSVRLRFLVVLADHPAAWGM